MAGMHDAITEEEASAMVARAIELGLVNFDTAPHYGLGIGEERLGKALRSVSAPIRVWTKVGRLIRPSGSDGQVEADNVAGRSIFHETPLDRVPVLDYSAKGARQSIAESKHRLGVHIHGARVHDPDDMPAAFEADGAFAGLRGLVAEISVGTNDPATAARALPLCDTVMLANCWNLIDQHGATLLAACARRKTPVHLAGVYASGLLAGRTSYLYSRDIPSAVQAKLRSWEDFAAKEGYSLKLLALAFSFLPTAVHLVAVGLRTAAEVDDTVQMIRQVQHVGLPRWRRVFKEAEKVGLLAPGSLDLCCDVSS